MSDQGVLFAEALEPDWPCLPHGPGNLRGHVWSEADAYAVCGCAMRVTFAQLGIPERARKERGRMRRTNERPPGLSAPDGLTK